MLQDRNRTPLSLVPLLAGAAVVCALIAPQAIAEPLRDAHQSADRLRNPYLLLHAHNPVDWYPWGPEAIARAKGENKPIFLSIGYSTCYWCHVAERTIYSNPEIAALMNQWFVNIKVDREERPDIDQTFMLARQIVDRLRRLAEQPVSDAGPQAFFCGKLFPAGRPGGHDGFPTILKLIHEEWEQDPASKAIGDQVQPP